MKIQDGNNGTVFTKKPTSELKSTIRSWFIGRPLPTADAPHQAINKFIGLAVFASDALSSTAYATQELLVILVLAGVSAFHYSIPISFAIVGLLAILIVSYQQVIFAYPNGGGSYIVARENLGEFWALVAGAALLTDYILTVSVSVSSGVAQIISAFPALSPWRVGMAVLFVFGIMLINLRGVRESGVIISIPSYFFIAIMLVMLVAGFLKWFSGSLTQVIDPPAIELIKASQPVTFFLLLRAFSNGTSAVTGVEAISNGITAFKEPRSRNAGITLIWMALILGIFLLGITFLANHIQAIPSESETVISQLARTIFSGRGIPYIMIIGGTTLILVMAANTAFADFPRLSALVSADGFLPRQLTYKGDRLVYSNGMIALAVVASLLIVMINASVTNLIPLYAIGVFLSFTISQIGMAFHWRNIGKATSKKELPNQNPKWKLESWLIKLLINGFGAITTAVVMVVFAVTKFTDGAWIVIILLPMIVTIFYLIKRHYQQLANQLSLTDYGSLPQMVRHRVILPLSGVHRGSLAALRYARTLSDDITAVHISIDQEETDKLRNKWEVWGDGTRLLIIDSQYRLFIEPLLEYIGNIQKQLLANEILTVVVPQFVPRRFWNNALHSRTANTLRKVLLSTENIVITEVPYHVR